MENLMKHHAVAFVALVAGAFSWGAAQADQFRLPEEIGRIEAPRDMNIFAIEPTVISERYYTSGQCERHQFVGNVLPAGSPIPDSDEPINMGVVQHNPAKATTQTKPAATTTPANSTTTPAK
jgi:hypothetical protein